MPLDLANIVPPNNLRLPDALTVLHGPARHIARFVLAADRAARGKGVFLRIRHDFDELLYVNRHYSSGGSWYPVLDGFNPECADIRPENSFWVSGENADGEIVVTVCSRMFDFSDTNLAQQVRTVWFGRDLGQPCTVTAEAAHRISGIVNFGGSLWVRPDFRGRGLAYLMPRVVKAYSCARWPIEWLFCFIEAAAIQRGVAHSYGHQNLSYSLDFPGSGHGEVVIGYTMLGEFYAELANFLVNIEAAEIGGSTTSSTPFEHDVTKTSAEAVFHGNSSLS